MHPFLSVAYVLLWRDMKALYTRLPNLLIDSGILLIIQVLNFGYFYPYLGLPEAYIAPLFIGTGIVEFLFHAGFTFSDELVEKIPFHKTTIMQYHLTLPISKTVLFAQYIFSFMIEKIIITTPLIIGGIWLLHPHFAQATGSIGAFIGTYLVVLIFVGLFFMTAAFSYEYDWFKDNVWSRRLSWFFNFSGIYLLWHVVYQLAPYAGMILLCNPFTYATEGLRSALLGESNALSLKISLCALCITSALLIARLRTVIIRRLDPV